MANAWNDVDRLVIEIDKALAAFDWTLAEAQVKSIVERSNGPEGPLPDPRARSILEALRRKRQINTMALLGDALVGLGTADARVRRQYAQALIEQHNLVAAEGVLRQIASTPSLTANEAAEAKGLLGRVYKQRYVDAKQPDTARQQENLRQAIRLYYEVYQSDPANRYWHGINVVALQARAERDGVAIEGLGLPRYQDLARTILDSFEAILDKTGSLDMWQRATALEARVALKAFDDAKADLFEYTRARDADAFEYYSTLRQLREVWQIEKDGTPGTFITTALQGALLQRSGGEVELQSRDVNDGLQVNFRGTTDLPYEWWQKGLRRCAAVARIEDTLNRKLGTGFLVRRSDFVPGSAGADNSPALALLTNWHVISENAEHPASIAPANAVANFEVCGKKMAIAKEMIAFSRKFDASLVALSDAEGLTDHCPLEPIPTAFEQLKQPRVYVIGHPGGRELSFSVHDSAWLATNGEKMHYRTPTEPGSSGSPVFDQQWWTLIGLHHRGLENMPKLTGDGIYQANEGFHVDAIRKLFEVTLKS